MFRDEKLLIRSSLILLICLSTTLYFGQLDVISACLEFVGFNSLEAKEFVGNIFIVENEFFSSEFNRYSGVIGYFISFMLIVILILLKKPKRKYVIISGVILLALGFLEMILLDISVVGWLIGSMMIIAGFLIYRKSSLFF